MTMKISTADDAIRVLEKLHRYKWSLEFVHTGLWKATVVYTMSEYARTPATALKELARRAAKEMR